MFVRQKFPWGTTVTAVLLAGFLAACASAPAKTAETTPTTPSAPAETPAAPETPAPAPEAPPAPAPEKPAPITAEELAAAEAAIAAAEAAGAGTETEGTAAALLQKAKDLYQAAKDQAEADPTAARALLKDSIAQAEAAKDQALRAQAARAETAARQAIADAEAAGAEQYAADLLKAARDALAQGVAQAPQDPAAALASFQDAAAQADAAQKQAAQAALEAQLANLDRDAAQAIADAEAVDADQWAADGLNAARQALTVARDQRTSAPSKAAESYQVALDEAKKALTDALNNRQAAALARLDEAEGRWKALQPDRWDPEGSAPIADQADAARKALADDYAAGKPLVDEAVALLEAAEADLAARLEKVKALGVQVQDALDAADAADAGVWVPEVLQDANDGFFAGQAAWKRFRLDAAEEAWATALFQAQSAAAQAQGALAKKQTEQLMLDTMKKLEDASGKTVVDPQDRIIPPQAWDGKKELEKLRAKPLSLVIPADGSVAVLGDVARVTYLDQAKDQWTAGVRAYNEGDLTLANESFLQAQKLVDTYLALAVDKVYTVRLVPERRDSLWRISEFDSIYGTPWDWPKIWRRNQKLVENPDLIYPGWQLIIPPQ